MAAEEHPHWYAVEHLPPGRVRVRVVWDGRVFVAARILDERAKRLRWATVDEHGRTIMLPPRGQEQRWGPEPSAWQPVDPATWDLPLPAPLFSGPQEWAMPWSRREVRGRLGSMAAQAAEAESIRAGVLAEIGEAEPVSRPPGRPEQWWRDASLVTYSAPGEISHAEAEARVCRAILTDGLRPEMLSASLAGTSAALAEVVAETVTSSDADDGRPRFEPTPRDLADYLTAMRWFALLNPPELWHPRRRPLELNQSQKLLVWRALDPPLSWRAIGKRISRTAEGARRAWGGALERVWRAANGLPVHDHVKTVDQLAALRARNRAWRAMQG